MEPIDNYSSTLEGFDKYEVLSNIFKEMQFSMQDSMGIPADMFETEKTSIKEEDLTTDKSFEKLKILVGEIFALGQQIGKEKARFGSEEAYKQWCVGKPQADIENMLLEIIKSISKLFADENKTLVKTPVKKKITPKEPIDKRYWQPPNPNDYKKYKWDEYRERGKYEEVKNIKYDEFLKSLTK